MGGAGKEAEHWEEKLFIGGGGGLDSHPVMLWDEKSQQVGPREENSTRAQSAAQ